MPVRLKKSLLKSLTPAVRNTKPTSLKRVLQRTVPMQLNVINMLLNTGRNYNMLFVEEFERVVSVAFEAISPFEHGFGLMMYYMKLV